MKLAISNIAWKDPHDPRVLKMLKHNGVSGIEVAPTKIWPNWEGASHEAAKEHKKSMENQGFKLPAMQAILFGKPELQIFNPETHRSFFEHIKLVANLANGLGSHLLVWGGPKNRKRGQKSYIEAIKIATEFFYKIAEIGKSHHCCIGLEPNPVEYGCDFITNVSDAKELVTTLNHPAFKLHLDSGGIYMCGEELANIIQQAGEFEHYHISEPMLGPIYGGVVDQKIGIEALRSIHYKKWVSIEMKQPASIHLLESSLTYVKSIVTTHRSTETNKPPI